MLKKWVVNLLCWVMGTWFFFIGTTIDSLGNPTYDKILIVWTALALVSFYLLKKYSKVFED